MCSVANDSVCFPHEVEDLKARVAELETAGRELVVYEWGDPAKGFEIAPSWEAMPETANIWRRFASLVGVPDKGEEKT